MVEITEVAPHSRAAAAGVCVGDCLIALNGHEIRDVLDYRFYLAETSVTLTLRRGEATVTVTVEKELYDDIGLDFATPLMDKKQSCRNRCIFCFIDQLPKGMRPSLYFKDDDARLSFLHGNYITLTNLTDADIDRILAMHISPINVSVHTTNPALRVQMMKNPRAGEVLSYLDRLAAGGISIHGQIVLCRGINDGAELDRSMRELARLYPALESVSVVPAGLTDHRDGLYPLVPFSPKECRAVLRRIDRFARKMKRIHGTRIFYAGDEFYIRGGKRLPRDAYYEEYQQIENGVGMVRSLEEELKACLKNVKKSKQFRSEPRTVAIATGLAAYGELRRLARRIEKNFSGLHILVYGIENHYFGEKITVAGLLTGADLFAQLQDKPLGEALLISRHCLRAEGDLFLCGMSKEELSEKLGVPVLPTADEGEAFLASVLGEREVSR